MSSTPQPVSQPPIPEIPKLPTPSIPTFPSSAVDINLINNIVNDAPQDNFIPTPTYPISQTDNNTDVENSIPGEDGKDGKDGAKKGRSKVTA